MSTNWKAGDKAVCVNDTASMRGLGKILSKGTIYLVERPGPNIGLHLCGVQDSGMGWHRDRFRKIVPACDRNEREQTELMPHKGFWENHP